MTDSVVSQAPNSARSGPSSATTPPMGGRTPPAVDAASVPPELVVHLQSLLELALQTARARTLYRAEGAKVLTGLYRRTPAGKALSRQLGDINSALKAVAGHELRSARVGMRTLGHFTVTLRTDEATLTLAVRPDGINVDSVEVTDGSAPT